MLQMYGTPRSSDGFKDDKTQIKRKIVSCLTVLTKATVYSLQDFFFFAIKITNRNINKTIPDFLIFCQGNQRNFREYFLVVKLPRILSRCKTPKNHFLLLFKIAPQTKAPENHFSLQNLRESFLVVG